MKKLIAVMLAVVMVMSLCAFSASVKTSRLGFIVIQLRERCEHVQVSQFSYSQAEIYVVEGNAETLVKSVDSLVNVFSYHEARTGNRCNILGIT